jgi:hypothetical protein
MRIKQLLESVSTGGMGTNSVATAPGKAGKMIRRQKPSDNALDSGKLFQETNAEEGVRDLGYDAQSLIMKLRRDVEEKRLQPTRQAVLSAARELAGDIDFAPELLVHQVLGQGVAEAQVDELSKDTLKQYIPRRIEKTKGLAKTDYDKAHRIIKKDIPRAMSKYKDPNYGKAQPTSPVDENKKGVRAVKHTTKPRNFVAKNAVATTSGAGAHKDKKKAMKQGETKHKGKEPAYESHLWAALDRRIIK